MSKVSIAGLEVDAITKSDFLEELSKRLSSGQKTFVITPYSEFLYAALRDNAVMAMLNKADIAISDGVGVLWAHRFLTIPFTVQSYYLKILEALWQMVYSLGEILLYPQSLYRTFPAKLTGADIVWDIAALAAKTNQSIYLLGGFADTPQRAAQKLQQKFSNLKIAGTSNKHPNDASVISDLQAASPDILLVAYGPIRQEQWVVDHYDQLPAKLMIGLGGTFDYIAGKKFNPPRLIRQIGLEWLYRLITQPTRLKRIINATIGLITAVIRYKVFESMPLRKNVVNVVFNKNDEVFVGKRKHKPYFLETDYWQFPQGGIDAMEQVVNAAKRELFEETAIQSSQVIAVSTHASSYKWINGRRRLWFNPLKYSGQDQNLVYWRFTGDDKEIKIDDDELVAYKWVPIDKVAEVIHPERLHLIDILQADIRDRKILEKPLQNWYNESYLCRNLIPKFVRGLRPALLGLFMSATCALRYSIF